MSQEPTDILTHVASPSPSSGNASPAPLPAPVNLDILKELAAACDEDCVEDAPPARENKELMAFLRDSKSDEIRDARLMATLATMIYAQRAELSESSAVQAAFSIMHETLSVIRETPVHTANPYALEIGDARDKRDLTESEWDKLSELREQMDKLDPQKDAEKLAELKSEHASIINQLEC